MSFRNYYEKKRGWINLKGTAVRRKKYYKKGVKFMKRLFTVFLMLAILLTMVTACGQKSGNETKTNETSSTKSEQTAKEIKNFNATGFPIVNEKITLTAMQQKDLRFGPLEKLWTVGWLEEKTNIHIAYEEIDMQSWNQKKQLAFASGTLPDIFIRSDFSTSEEVMYGSEGKMLTPLSGLIDQYAPNIQKAFKDYPAYKPSITTPEGEIYVIGQLKDGPLQIGLDRAFINTKWLNDLGLTVPKTVDEMHAALKAFKKRDPKAIPVSGVYGNPVNNTIKTWFFAYGFSDTRIAISTKDKSKVVYVPYEPEYEALLTELSSLYKEGLLDSDYFIQTDAELKAKSSEVKVGVCMWGAPFGQGGMPDPDNYLQYDGVYPLTSEYSTTPVWRGSDVIDEGNFAMSSTNKYPEATIRWVDHLYTEEAGIKIFYGPAVGENKDMAEYGYEIKSDGKLVSKIPEGNTVFLFTVGNWTNRDLPFRWPKLNYSESFAATDESLLKAVTNQLKHKVDLFPRVYIDTAKQERLVTLEADIKSYVEQMEAKFIAGVEPLSNFSKYRENLEKAGVQEYIKIYQDAYNVYLSNQEK